MDSSGQLITDGDGSRLKTVADNDLRRVFPQPGKATKGTGPADTPAKKLQAAVAELSDAVSKLEEAASAVQKVQGHGGALVNEAGIAPAHVVAWVRVVEEVRDRLQRWRWVAESRTVASAGDSDDEPSGLEALEDHDLASLAADAGLDVDGATDRDALIDILLDAGITGPDDRGADVDDAEDMGVGGDEAAVA